MMKKYLFLLLIGAASLTACGDDDDPVVPELNKLTFLVIKTELQVRFLPLISIIRAMARSQI